jgi:hypothetical protein
MGQARTPKGNCDSRKDGIGAHSDQTGCALSFSPNLELSDFEHVIVEAENGAGTIQSTLHAPDGNDPYNICVDGIKSLLLAMACQNIDLGTPEMKAAPTDALQACANVEELD